MPNAYQIQVYADYATIIACVVGIMAAVFVALQIYSMKKSRVVDTFLRIYEVSNTSQFCEAAYYIKSEINTGTSYKETGEKENRIKLSLVINYFEMVGNLVNNRYLPINIVYDQMGTWVVGTWSKLEKLIKQHRVEKSNPQYAENFELLASKYDKWAQIKPLRFEKRQRAKSDSISGFYKS